MVASVGESLTFRAHQQTTAIEHQSVFVSPFIKYLTRASGGLTSACTTCLRYEELSRCGIFVVFTGEASLVVTFRKTCFEEGRASCSAGWRRQSDRSEERVEPSTLGKAVFPSPSWCQPSGERTPGQMTPGAGQPRACPRPHGQRSR